MVTSASPGIKTLKRIGIMMIPANIGMNTQTRLRKKPISTLLRYAKTSVRTYTIARSRMSWVIATAKMRTTIETSFMRGSRLCSRPLRWAMLSFTRHSSKNVKMSRDRLLDKTLLFADTDRTAGAGADFDLLHPLRYHRISCPRSLHTFQKAGTSGGLTSRCCYDYNI